MIGGIAANALNIYSGAISFTAIGFKLPLAARRAIVALGFGIIGFFVAWSALGNAGADYNNFLLIISYWIAPWLAIMFCDMYLRRRQDPARRAECGGESGREEEPLDARRIARDERGDGGEPADAQ